MESRESSSTARPPWNKGKLVGQKAPFKLKEIWAIRIRLQLAGRRRELALFNLAIDSKLRACDLVKLRVRAPREICLPTLRSSLARSCRGQKAYLPSREPSVTNVSKGSRGAGGI